MRVYIFSVSSFIHKGKEANGSMRIKKKGMHRDGDADELLEPDHVSTI